MLQEIATERPTHGIEFRSENNINIDINTKKIDSFFLKFNISLKKTYPNKTLKIGIIKYPKLASIILLEATAYIQTAQFKKIKKPEINKEKINFLFFKIFKKFFCFFKYKDVKIKATAVQIHR